MANEEQLAILKQGVDVWNRWVAEQHVLVDIDLSNADLEGFPLDTAFLRNANLNAANLHGCSLTSTDLRYSSLKEACLSNCNFFNTELSDAALSKTDFSFSTFNGAILGFNDLKTCVGLDTCTHENKSTIGTDTITTPLQKGASSPSSKSEFFNIIGTCSKQTKNTFSQKYLAQ